MKLSKTARRLAGVLVPALALVLAAAGCASTSTTDAAAPASSGKWTYTDDTGKTVTLPERPTRIASFTDYALGLLSDGIKPVAIFGRVPVKTDSRFDKFDISKTAIVGNSYGEIDLEKLAEAQPQLIVTGTYPTDRKGDLDRKAPLYAFASLDQQAQIEKIAPVVAIKIGGKGIDVIHSLNRLAESLGASPARIAAAKKKFDTAAADLTAAAKENDIQVTQAYADADGMYVVKPDDEPETQLYKSLGVDYTNLHPNGKYYWDIYSWENVSKMETGDIVLMNVEGFGPSDLKKQPTFASDPALKAGQVYAWQDAALDYASQAAHMELLAKLIRSAKKVTS